MVGKTRGIGSGITIGNEMEGFEVLGARIGCRYL